MISVVIPCKNAARWLSETLNSLQEQEYLTEIIIIDNYSTDNSVSIAQSFTKLPITIISSPKQGVSTARNIGIKYAKEEWIQFLDADDVLLPYKLKRQYELGMTYEADVVYGSWQAYREQENGSFKPQEVIKPDYSENCVAQLLSSNAFCQIGAMLFQKKVLLAVGGFSVDMSCIEDVNLYLRLAFNKAKFIRDTGDVAILYRKHKASISLGSSNLLAFHAGCLRNGILAETTWRKHGKDLSITQKQTLLQIYGSLARFYFEHDRTKFHEILSRIRRLDPNYLPTGPTGLRLLSKWLGYERAETIALSYRRTKKLIQTLVVPSI